MDSFLSDGLRDLITQIPLAVLVALLYLHIDTKWRAFYERESARWRETFKERDNEYHHLIEELQTTIKSNTEAIARAMAILNRIANGGKKE